MLIESYYYLKDRGMDASNLFLFGQEINDETWAMAKMNVLLHPRCSPARIRPTTATNNK